MNDLKDLRFGKWTVIEKAEVPAHITKKQPGLFWKRICDCGTTEIVNGSNLSLGLSTGCKHCATKLSEEEHKERKLAYKKSARGKEADRKSRLKTKFGITIEDYNRMFEEQNGCCKICHRHQSEFKRAFHVDHEHVEGYDELPLEEKAKYVRGLLCQDCNILLGYAHDNIEVLQNAIQYLN